MEQKKASKDRLKISKFKLNALLDITLSINANLPTEELLSKYESTLRNNLGIGKILIFKHDDKKWECILNAGFPKHFGTTFWFNYSDTVMVLAVEPFRFW